MVVIAYLTLYTYLSYIIYMLIYSMLGQSLHYLRDELCSLYVSRFTADDHNRKEGLMKKMRVTPSGEKKKRPHLTPPL